MGWPSIAILIIGALLWLAAFTFAAMIIILRLSPAAGKLLAFLDPQRLRKAQRRALWLLVPFGLCLVAGVVLIVLHISPILFVLGILLVSLPPAALTGIMLIGEVARSIVIAGKD